MPQHATNPLASVVIPTYNRAELLRLAIESVLAQTYPAVEIIVVDDGSTDATPALLASYGGRITAIRQPNRGGAAARNAGLAAARGAFVSFLDHDDLLLPDKIARQVTLLVARPEAGLAHCGYYRIDRHGRRIDTVVDLPEGDVRVQLVQGCFLWSGAPLIRRTVLERVGPFDETVWSSDADMWLRIALAGYHFACVQEPLGCYRILPDSGMADVARTERLDMAILDRTFADPRLPAAARAKRRDAYFNQRFWLSTRYYAVGQWEDARRNLRLALKLRPELLIDPPDELVQWFVGSALDPRVPDPLRYVEDLLGQLPPEVAAVLRPHAPTLYSQVLLDEALRGYACGEVDAARADLGAAIARDRRLAERPEQIEQRIVHSALRLSTAPHRFVEMVLGNLPDEARALAQRRARLLASVSIAAAFDSYARGQRREVPALVLRALRARPELLASRGVLSITARSLPALLREPRPTGPPPAARSRAGDRDLPADAPLVSVIIPTHNRAAILPATLASVLAQTYPRIEIVVVDDGSTDGTCEVVARYGDRVRYVWQKQQGVEAARRRGLQVSGGALISFLDDDDLLLPDKIARQVAVLRSQPEAGLVHCRYHYIDSAGQVMETSGMLPAGDVRRPLVWGCFPWSGGPLVRRECLAQIGADEHRDWYSDWGMWLRVALAGHPFACIQEPLGCYRIAAGSMIDTQVANCERLVFHLLDEVFRRWTLPPAVVAERDRIAASWRFWLSCRYYLGEHWEDGKRNLAAALRLRPELLERPDELVQLWCDDALGARARVRRPEAFIEGIFDHLPAEAAALASLRGRVLGRVNFGLALHSYGRGCPGEGRARLGVALRQTPALLDRPEALLEDVYHYAFGQPHRPPLLLIAALLRALPPEAAPLHRLRRRILGDAILIDAFQSYAAGQLRQVPGRFIAAACLRPAVLTNRGALAILGRSLLAMLRHSPQPRATGGRP